MSIHYSRNAEVAQSVPSVNIASKNNRLKRYDTNTTQPIYYLHQGKEFQIELFNPTTDIIKCDISLNGKLLPGGGLVLKPGQRAFLDRHLNSPEKFIFETYEVGTSASVEKAIAKNGLVKVEFYREKQQFTPNWQTTYTQYDTWSRDYNGIHHTGSPVFGSPSTTTDLRGVLSTNTTTDSFNTTNMVGTVTNTVAGLDSLDMDLSYGETLGRRIIPESKSNVKGTMKRMKAKSSKKQETGMVGKGGHSDQKFTMVHYDFEYTPFYTVEYKLLPYSQKVNTIDTISVKRYCTECGSKIKSNFKFCAQCGNRT